LIHKKQRYSGEQYDSPSQQTTTTTTTTTTTDSVARSLNEDEKDEILGYCLDAGAEDVDFGHDSDDHFLIQCSPHELHTLVTKLRSSGFIVSEFENRYIPKLDCIISLDSSSSLELSNFIEKLDDDEDVSSFYHSATICE
jgi:transcriptional/translational regulatory protein YebC/TACO1